MSGEHLNRYARRVISGRDAEGRSTIVSDENSPARIAVSAWTVNSIWQIDELPARLDDAGELGPVALVPPMGSFMYRMATFPPDTEVTAEKIRESMKAMGGEDSIAEDSDIMGLPSTKRSTSSPCWTVNCMQFSRPPRRCCDPGIRLASAARCTHGATGPTNQRRSFRSIFP